MIKYGSNTFETENRREKDEREGMGERERNMKGRREAVSRIRIPECNAFSMLSAVTVPLTSQGAEDRATLQRPPSWIKCAFPASDQL